MASSGAWENIILTKTPTSEGVCGMLYFIIVVNFCQRFWLCWQMVSTFLLTDGRSTFISIFMTDVIVIILFYHWCYWQMLMPCGLIPLKYMVLTLTKVDLPSVNKKVDTICQQNQNLWQKFKTIIKYNIPHTPSEVGVLVSIIFSHAPEEAMSSGLAKACVPSKNQSCSREIEFLNEY